MGTRSVAAVLAAAALLGAACSGPGKAERLNAGSRRPAPTTAPTAAQPPAAPATTPARSAGVTQPCPVPDGGRLKGVEAIRARPSGVWVELEGAGAGAPVLVGSGDGGATWTSHCLAGIGATEALFFVDDAHGWAAVTGSTAGRVLLTADGGATWRAARLPDPATFVHDVYFLDARRGFAAGDTGGAPAVLRSTDGGRTWTALSPTALPLASTVRFVDTLHGWVADADRQIAATADGGATWTVARLIGAEDEFLRDLAFADRLHGWAVTATDDARAGTLWATVDGGRTWAPTHRFPHGVSAVTVLDAGHLLVAGGLPVVVEYSGDGGTAWSRTTLPAAFTDVGVLDRSVLWAYSTTADRAGCLYRTGDGGRTWSGHAVFGSKACPGVTPGPAAG